MKTITVAESAGFCFGVDRALALCSELLESGRSIATLGPIIHNDRVVGDLARRGAVTVETPDETPPGAVLVVRSHGVAPDILSYCAKNGIEFADATCPFVTKIHDIVGKNNIEKKPVLIAGDKNHPEIVGIVGHCAAESFTFESPEELEEILRKQKSDKTFIMVAQTTFNLLKYSECVEQAKKLHPALEVHDTICNATITRQREAERLARENDVCVVIGGKTSSNTKKLAEVCAASAVTYCVEGPGQLHAGMFASAQSIGVTAGASTPAPLIEEVLIRMSEIIKDEEFNFEQALEDSVKPVRRNQRVVGIVTEIRPNEVVVDIGTKQTGFVPADEMSDDSTEKLEDIVKVGDEISLLVTKVNDQEGIIMLSKKKVDAQQGFDNIASAVDDGSVLDAYVTELVNKGMIATVKGVRVFIPASHATLRRDEPYDQLLHTHVNIKVLEVNPARRRAIGSIRAVLQEERDKQREAVWDSIEVGATYEGVVKSIMSYGAFVDIGGVDGMVHVSELGWGKISNPADVVAVGDEVEVTVKEIDREKNRISLTMRKEEDNPWILFREKYNIGDEFESPVVSLPKFGAFVNIMPGIDGLIHISEMSYDHVEKPSDILAIGDVVNVKLIGVDAERQRISLTMKFGELSAEAERQREELKQARAEAAAAEQQEETQSEPAEESAEPEPVEAPEPEAVEETAAPPEPKAEEQTAPEVEPVEQPAEETESAESGEPETEE